VLRLLENFTPSFNSSLNPWSAAPAIIIHAYVQKNYLQSLGVLLENFIPLFNPSILGVQHLLEYFMLPFSPKEISAIPWSAAPA
jgi:hypothetical protein